MNIFINKAIKAVMADATSSAFPGTLWYSDIAKNNLVEYAVDMGWAIRPSVTQVEWTETGIEAMKIVDVNVENKCFNCCENGQLPNMKVFTNLEVALIKVGKDGSHAVVPGAAEDNRPVTDKECVSLLMGDFSDPEALNFTVYGRYAPSDDNEGTEALHDCKSYEEAESLVNALTNRFTHLTTTHFC